MWGAPYSTTCLATSVVRDTGCNIAIPSRRKNKDERGIACGVIVAGLNGEGLGLHKAPSQGVSYKGGEGGDELVGAQHAQRDDLLEGAELAPPGLGQRGMIRLQAVVDLLPGDVVDCNGVWQTLHMARPVHRRAEGD